MADISTLSGLAPVEQLDLSNYQPNQPKKGFQLPRAGVYQLQAPASFPSEAFGVSSAGALTVQIDPTIVGPTNEGYLVKFQRVSAKVFQRNGQNVSLLGDYLEACGVNGVFTTPQELADAAEATAGTVYSAYLDWELNKDGVKIRGMKNFPAILNDKGEPTGDYQPWVNHPTAKNDDGSPKRLFANVRITNYISPRG